MHATDARKENIILLRGSVESVEGTAENTNIPLAKADPAVPSALAVSESWPDPSLNRLVAMAESPEHT